MVDKKSNEDEMAYAKRLSEAVKVQTQLIEDLRNGIINNDRITTLVREGKMTPNQAREILFGSYGLTRNNGKPILRENDIDWGMTEKLIQYAQRSLRQEILRCIEENGKLPDQVVLDIKEIMKHYS